MNKGYKDYMSRLQYLKDKINLTETCSCKVPYPTSHSFGKGIFHYCKTCFKNYDKPYYVSRSKAE